MVQYCTYIQCVQYIHTERPYIQCVHTYSVYIHTVIHTVYYLWGWLNVHLLLQYPVNKNLWRLYKIKIWVTNSLNLIQQQRSVVTDSFLSQCVVFLWSRLRLDVRHGSLDNVEIEIDNSNIHVLFGTRFTNAISCSETRPQEPYRDIYWNTLYWLGSMTVRICGVCSIINDCKL
jgi:hypothetical protein